MKLNIYKNKKIVKTYEAESYDLMFGTLEDIAAAVKLDKLETGSNAEIIKLIGDLMVSASGTVKDLMKDIFDGLTDAELRNVKVSEMMDVLIDAVVFTVMNLNKSFIGGDEKN